MEEGVFWFGLYHVIILLGQVLLTQKEKLSFRVKFKLETPSHILYFSISFKNQIDEMKRLAESIFSLMLMNQFN